MLERCSSETLGSHEYRSKLQAADAFPDGILVMVSNTFMKILTELFEHHFHAPVVRIQALQGELGGSGRKIVRLTGNRTSAIGILYGVREENVAFLEFSR